MKNSIFLFLLVFLASSSRGQQKPWWAKTIVYQIYPRSFQDANGDGIGDLKGIIQKLDYLQWLGVETIWINPFFKSPGYDNGYDVSDYYEIDPVYGTMEDFDALSAALKKRKMRLILDVVLNHTSIEHPWFKAARSSRDNPYHGYYLWKPGVRGRLPNNWPSIFGGSAWEWNDPTQEYYLHSFLVQQPDLNWDNAQVRQDLYKILRFWSQKGVDGFRLDAISLISKDTAFPSMDFSKGIFSALNGVMNDGPHLHAYLQEMAKQVFQPNSVYTVGEVYTEKDSAWEFIAPGRGELSTMHFFDLMHLPDSNWSRMLKGTLDGWDRASRLHDSWNTILLSTHDFPRAVSRLGGTKRYWRESAKLLATLLLTWRGTPFIYQGDELGMTNYPFANLSEIDDRSAQSQYAELTGKQGMSDSVAFAIIRRTTRDNARTPMQWNKTTNAGFTVGGHPWLKVNPNYDSVNATLEREDPSSILNYYRQLITLRKSSATLVSGDFEDMAPGDPSLYLYSRTLDGERWIIVLNMSGDMVSIGSNVLPDPAMLRLSNYDDGNKSAMVLQPYEARIYQIH